MESSEREVLGMTDREFLNHLYEILTIANKCKDLDEFKKDLQSLIDNYIKK